MDGPRRTYHHAFPAETAFVEIDVCHIVLDSYGSERTLLLAFAASDAGCLAGLACNCALVLVHAAYEYPAALRAFVAQLDDISSSTTGSPVTGSMERAPNWQAAAQSPHPRQPNGQAVSPL